MKRAVLTIIVCVMTTLAGMAQGKWSLMPKAGVNIGMLGDEGGKGTSPRVGFAVGFEAENHDHGVGSSDHFSRSRGRFF